MTDRFSAQRMLLLAGTAGVFLFTSTAAFSQAGMSPIDKSNPGASKQDGNLKPHATPPVATPVEKIPVDKIKLPAGFKAEIWSHGHPGGRTMVLCD
jgi:hypothetical protein